MVNKDIIIARLLEQVQLLTEQNLQLHSEVQQLREKIARPESLPKIPSLCHNSASFQKA